MYTEAATISFFFSSRRRHTISKRDWSSDVCSSDLGDDDEARRGGVRHLVEQVAEALDVVVVERRVDLVEHADRRRVRQDRKSVVGKECRSRWSQEDERIKREREE